MSFKREIPADIGIRQKEIQDDRHEYLRVALSKDYMISPGPSTAIDRVNCRTIQFPSRPDLESICEFRPYVVRDEVQRMQALTHRRTPSSPLAASNPIDSIIAIAEVKTELDRLEKDERYREGGILYLVGHQNLFWTMILVWHRSGTTGHKGWDYVLQRILTDLDNLSLCDCMFFCTPYGCHVDDCQYLHSVPRKDACDNFNSQKAQRHVCKLETLVEETGSETDEVDMVFEELEQEAQELKELADLHRHDTMGSMVSSTSSESSNDFEYIDEEDFLQKNRSSAAIKAYEAEMIVAQISRQPRDIFCKTCGKQEPVGEKFKLCSRCRRVRYCGRQCQEDDWKTGHAKNCNRRPRHSENNQ
ncbi:hypothetical protein HK096_001183 [Nowakowskiella sp. JEL0078]|nr:hypothetical protein HK096_001183 [Nowakowskiella sp. JEL0078]